MTKRGSKITTLLPDTLRRGLAAERRGAGKKWRDQISGPRIIDSIHFYKKHSKIRTLLPTQNDRINVATFGEPFGWLSPELVALDEDEQETKENLKLHFDEEWLSS